MKILSWGWVRKYSPGFGLFQISCENCMYWLAVEDWYVIKGTYSDNYGYDYNSVYPYRSNSKLNCWVNCSGEYTLDYFKRLLKAGKIILK